VHRNFDVACPGASSPDFIDGASDTTGSGSSPKGPVRCIFRAIPGNTAQLAHQLVALFSNDLERCSISWIDVGALFRKLLITEGRGVLKTFLVGCLAVFFALLQKRGPFDVLELESGAASGPESLITLADDGIGLLFHERHFAFSSSARAAAIIRSCADSTSFIRIGPSMSISSFNPSAPGATCGKE